MCKHTGKYAQGVTKLLSLLRVDTSFALTFKLVVGYEYGVGVVEVTKTMREPTSDRLGLRALRVRSRDESGCYSNIYTVAAGY